MHGYFDSLLLKDDVIEISCERINCDIFEIIIQMNFADNAEVFAEI